MKTSITFSRQGQSLSSIALSQKVIYDGSVALPNVGDIVGRYISGDPDHPKGKVILRQFTYFDDELAVFLVME